MQNGMLKEQILCSNRQNVLIYLHGFQLREWSCSHGWLGHRRQSE